MEVLSIWAIVAGFLLKALRSEDDGQCGETVLK